MTIKYHFLYSDLLRQKITAVSKIKNYGYSFSNISLILRSFRHLLTLIKSHFFSGTCIIPLASKILDPGLNKPHEKNV